MGDYAVQAQRRWAVWLRKQHLTDQVPDEFGSLLRAIGEFADPAFQGDVTDQTWNAVRLTWLPKSPSSRRDASYAN